MLVPLAWQETVESHRTVRSPTLFFDAVSTDSSNMPEYKFQKWLVKINTLQTRRSDKGASGMAESRRANWACVVFQHLSQIVPCPRNLPEVHVNLSISHRSVPEERSRERAEGNAGDTAGEDRRLCPE
ncbi:hypothetical protein CEXT_541571 [Caerostris extrusa]|uniref:Uncharacterized protein n=1 Tax=Caerostris extrusa TaxID=172846 RepID=A0AAV4UN23_CAEEX|nr:hypothetical protein CEXT_541571 [Caerostris extrusa]